MYNYFGGIMRVFGKKSQDDVICDGVDNRFCNRNVLVGIIRGKSQYDILVRERFYHIPIAKVSGCDMPIKYIAIYLSRKNFGKGAGVKIIGEVESCTTLPRSQIREIPRKSDEPYLYFKIKRWVRLPNTIYAKEMDEVAFSTTMFLIKNCRNSSELKIRSAREYDFYNNLVRIVKKLVKNHIPDYNDIVYKDYTIKLKGGLLYLYFADVIECVIGYDIFLQNPMDIVRVIFDYYPEI